MKNDEAKRAIVREWDRWIKAQPGSANPTGRDAFKFFLELQAARSPLLDFRAGTTDKWQIVHGWLLSASRVPD